MTKFKCVVCGYIHTGIAAPDICPVCGAGKDKFASTSEATKSLDEYVNAQINGEAWEVVHYMALAMLAENLGHGGVGTVIRQIAAEEAGHGANYAFRSGAVGQDLNSLKDWVKKMIQAELGAHKMKLEGSAMAQAGGKGELAGLFYNSAKDEARHAKMWEWCLKQLG